MWWSLWCALLLLLPWTTLFSSTMTTTVRATEHGMGPPPATRLTDLFPHLPYGKGYSEFFGGSSNIKLFANGSGVNLVLDKHTGAGFVSQEKYYYGFFSAAIKLPSDYSAGVVVAFYMSNADIYSHNHDEIDFEFLGHEKRKDWVLQTNIYGNGSVGTGREEKFKFWFDPTEDFHQYSIIWNYHHTVFLVDNIPVREVNHTEAISTSYPSKPMSVYSTIWDGSEWATHGGKKPVNYKFEPFVASFKDMEIGGCVWNRTNNTPVCPKNNLSGRLSMDPVGGQDFVKLSQQQQKGMDWVRDKFMLYSYCKDPDRYKVLPPECGGNKKKVGLPSEMSNFFHFSRVKAPH